MSTVRAPVVLLTALLTSCAQLIEPTRSSVERFTDTQLYAEAVRTKIRGHLVLPLKVPSSATALVNLSLSDTGMIADLSLVRSSGYTEYDHSIRTAIILSQPLPLLIDSAGQVGKTLQLIFKAGE